MVLYEVGSFPPGEQNNAATVQSLSREVRPEWRVQWTFHELEVDGHGQEERRKSCATRNVHKFECVYTWMKHFTCTEYGCLYECVLYFTVQVLYFFNVRIQYVYAFVPLYSANGIDDVALNKK